MSEIEHCKITKIKTVHNDCHFEVGKDHIFDISFIIDFDGIPGYLVFRSTNNELAYKPIPAAVVTDVDYTPANKGNILNG